MIELDFSTVSWTFMLAIFLAKTAVFFGVIGITLFILRRNGLAKSGLYAICATQSNDFALGYPIGILNYLSISISQCFIYTVLVLKKFKFLLNNLCFCLSLNSSHIAMSCRDILHHFFWFVIQGWFIK